MAKLFVYGTLQRGYRLNYVLEDMEATFECRAATIKHYSMLFGGNQKGSYNMFPVVIEPVNGSPKGPIAGEVYQMPEDCDWSYLDRIENMYNRTLISDPGEEEVYLYVGKPHSWRFDHGKTTRPHTDGILYWMLPSE